VADKMHAKTEEAIRMVRAGTHTRYQAAKQMGIALSTIYRYNPEDTAPTLPRSFKPKQDPPKAEPVELVEPKKPRWTVKTS